ncbi:MAG: glutamine-hydrolyzing carbamoyl-phosphate synthase small subunit [Thermodesulfobacteriota bacterium]|nr:glutamine-hydrolyzing carbamoyl-phosphate synthase small subunit [Thermodesulfobacteriota bacterium]
MKAVITTEDLCSESALHKVKRSPEIKGRDLVKEVTCVRTYRWAKKDEREKREEIVSPLFLKPFHVVVMDFGIKHTILKELTTLSCEVTVVPAHISADEIMTLKPDGVLLSNGPGDPAPVGYAIETIARLLGKVPIFGICLGHQLLSLALGARTYKLKFGHRGGNQPVKNMLSGKVEITTQNHGFSVDTTTLNTSCIEITHINLNDGTLEGIRHKNLPAFSVQYHPEASPGPHDAKYLFVDFLNLMENSKKYNA